MPRAYYSYDSNWPISAYRACISAVACALLSVCVCSPARWRVWTTPGCRPGSRCPCSAAPDPSACSRSAGSGRRCRPLTPAARVGGGTRRWPSLLPGGRCTAAPGEGWSCSTPATGQGTTRSRISRLEYVHFYCHRLFRLNSGFIHSNVTRKKSGVLNSLTLLSLPPDARCWWSGDHLRPHTSCL